MIIELNLGMFFFLCLLDMKVEEAIEVGPGHHLITPENSTMKLSEDLLVLFNVLGIQVFHTRDQRHNFFKEDVIGINGKKGDLIKLQGKHLIPISVFDKKETDGTYFVSGKERVSIQRFAEQPFMNFSFCGYEVDTLEISCSDGTILGFTEITKFVKENYVSNQFLSICSPDEYINFSGVLKVGISIEITKSDFCGDFPNQKNFVLWIYLSLKGVLEFAFYGLYYLPKGRFFRFIGLFLAPITTSQIAATSETLGSTRALVIASEICSSAFPCLGYAFFHVSYAPAFHNIAINTEMSNYLVNVALCTVQAICNIATTVAENRKTAVITATISETAVTIVTSVFAVQSVYWATAMVMVSVLRLFNLLLTAIIGFTRKCKCFYRVSNESSSTKEENDVNFKGS